MKWQRFLLGTLSVFVLALVLAGCARRTVVVREPARTVYVAPPPTAPPVTVVQVQQAPPEVVVETRPTAPGRNHVWVSGYWTWSGSGWAWKPGYWVKPPRPHAEWVTGHWERVGGGWQFHEGYWR